MSAAARRRPPPAAEAGLTLGVSLGAAALLCAAWLWAGLPAASTAVFGLACTVAAVARGLGSLRRLRAGGEGVHAVVGLVAALVLCVLGAPLHGVALLVQPLLAASVLLLWWLAGALWRVALLPEGPVPRGAPPLLAGFERIGLLREMMAGQFLLVGGLAFLARLFQHTAGAGGLLLAAGGGAAQLLCGLWLLEARVRQTFVGAAAQTTSGGSAPARWLAAAVVAVGLLLPVYASLPFRRGGATVVRSGSQAPPPTAQTPPPVPPPPRAASLPDRPPSPVQVHPQPPWLPAVEHLIPLVAALLLLAVVVRWIHRLWRALGWRGLVARLREFLWVIMRLFARPLAWGGRFRGDLAPRRAPTESERAGRFGRGHAATDPRGRVRRAYRHLLVEAWQRGHLRAPGQSPRRFGDTLQPQVGEAASHLRALTGLYEEARYSGHPVAGTDADRATLHARAAVRALRDARGRRAGVPDSRPTGRRPDPTQKAPKVPPSTG